MAETYRICRTKEPHRDEYFTVERLRHTWFGREAWENIGRGYLQISFRSEAAAQHWIDEAKSPTVHECGAAQ